MKRKCKTECANLLYSILFFCKQEKHMVVWVEAAILDDEALLKDKKFQKIKDKLVTFK